MSIIAIAETSRLYYNKTTLKLGYSFPNQSHLDSFLSSYNRTSYRCVNNNKYRLLQDLDDQTESVFLSIDCLLFNARSDELKVPKADVVSIHSIPLISLFDFLKRQTSYFECEYGFVGKNFGIIFKDPAVGNIYLFGRYKTHYQIKQQLPIPGGEILIFVEISQFKKGELKYEIVDKNNFNSVHILDLYKFNSAAQISTMVSCATSSRKSPEATNCHSPASISTGINMNLQESSDLNQSAPIGFSSSPANNTITAAAATISAAEAYPPVATALPIEVPKTAATIAHSDPPLQCLPSIPDTNTPSHPQKLKQWSKRSVLSLFQQQKDKTLDSHPDNDISAFNVMSNPLGEVDCSYKEKFDRQAPKSSISSSSSSLSVSVSSSGTGSSTIKKKRVSFHDEVNHDDGHRPKIAAFSAEIELEDFPSTIDSTSNIENLENSGRKRCKRTDEETAPTALSSASSPSSAVANSHNSLFNRSAFSQHLVSDTSVNKWKTVDDTAGANIEVQLIYDDESIESCDDSSDTEGAMMCATSTTTATTAGAKE